MPTLTSTSSGTETGAEQYTDGLKGDVYYDAGAGVYEVQQMMGVVDPQASFVSTTLDYGWTMGTLTDLLGVDAGSLSDASAGEVRDAYGLRFTGQIYLEAGTYEFYSSSDDGFKLSIGGLLIDEYWAGQPFVASTSSVEVLDAGWYDIELDYLESSQTAGLNILYSLDGGATQEIDGSMLRHAADATTPGDTGSDGSALAGLAGALYLSSANLTGLDDALALTTGPADATFVASGTVFGSTNGGAADLIGGDAASLVEASTGAGQQANNFVLTLTGEIYLEAGWHEFANRTDDGFRLSIDGSVIAEYAENRAPRTTTGGVWIDSDGYYAIRVDYYDAGGGATLEIRHQLDGGGYTALEDWRLRHSADDVAPLPDPEDPVTNAAPVAVNDSVAVAEDNSVTLNLLANDSDPDGDSLQIVALGATAHGTLVDNGDGTVTYTPYANFNGTDTFSYTISDGQGGTAVANATVSVRARNDSPVVAATPAAVTMGEAESVSIDLSTYFSDVDGDTLNYSVSGAAFASIAGSTLNIVTTDGQNGAYDLVVTATDPAGASAAATIGLTVEDTMTPPPPPDENTAPVGVNETAVVNEDGSVVIDILANDTDADGDTLSLLALGQPTHGSVTDNGNGTVTYTPDANYNGTDRFTYTISDGNGGTARAATGIRVDAVNDAPVASDDTGFSVDAGNSVSISLADLLGNDSDLDGDTLSITGITNVSNGSAMLMGDHVQFTGTAAGAASFDYILSDGQGGTDRATVSVTVATGSGGTDSGGGDDHGSGHSSDGFEPIDPPQTAAEIAAFVAEVRAAPETMAHSDDPAKMADHMRAMALVPRDEATHIAVKHGDWNDPSTWHNGQVPGEDARVLIPEGIAVSYGEVNNASLFSVRVDGMLDFATDHDSRMLVDTIVVSPTGHLVIGTEDDPVDSDVNVDIVFADNGDIDVNWDPALLSRGMIAHGTTSIYGTEKSSHLKVDIDAMAGDTHLTLAEAPEGWQVGDKLVLTGTHEQGWAWNNRTGRLEHTESQDEEVYITAINGNVVTLADPLRYDHDTPRDDLKAYAANMTRNVTFSSEGGDGLPVYQRGHVMFMHSDDVDVRYAGFVDLGRTDKSRVAGDPDYFGGVGNLEADTNIKSRYPFHFHETGVDDLENPAMAVGNVVDGSPGWGFVHHSSNANFTENVAYDVFGAAFAAEDGNETGIWYRNIAIDAEGIGIGDYTVKQLSDVDRDDNGRTGDGFFFAGRLVEAAENVAANTTNGYVWLHRGPRDMIDPDTTHHPELGYGRDYLLTDKAPIQGFHDNEAFGTNSGIIVVKDNADQGHDVRTVFDGFLNWETREGLNVSYTSHYTFLDIDLVAKRVGANAPMLSGPENAVQFGTGAFDMVINGIRADGFANGIYVYENNSISDHLPGRDFHNTVIDAEMTNIRGSLAVEAFSGQVTFLSGAELSLGRLLFDYTGDTSLGPNEALNLDGYKTDSIGTVDRNFDIEQQGLDYWETESLLASEGYYRLADGTPIVLFEDYIADRATGELSKQNLVFRLDFSSSALSRYEYNGVIELGGPAPVATHDVARIGEDQRIYLDLVANDIDPDGGRVYVDGLADPRHGDVFMQDDGTVLYRPNLGFNGVDSFTYWVADEEGNFTKATATVVVGDVPATVLEGALAGDVFEFQ